MDNELVSNCCGAKIIDTDICTKCKEHSEPINLTKEHLKDLLHNAFYDVNNLIFPNRESAFDYLIDTVMEELA